MDPTLPYQHFLATKLEMQVAESGELPATAPSITISRQAGARAVSIAEKLTQHLETTSRYRQGNWTLFDQELVKTIIEDHHLPPEAESLMAEDRPLPMTDRIKELFTRKIADWTLFEHSVHTIWKLCGMGHAIVVGRGGNFIAADLTNTFCVRLVGSVAQRTQHLQHKYGLTEKAALELIDQKDTARRAYVRTHFHHDIDDPTGYDLIVNTDDFSDDAAVHIIAYALQEWATISQNGD